MEDVSLSPFYKKKWKIDAETAADSWGFICINMVRLNAIEYRCTLLIVMFNVCNLNVDFLGYNV